MAATEAPLPATREVGIAGRVSRVAHRDPYPLGVATLSVAIFLWIGASIGLFVATAASYLPHSEFYSRNALGDAARTALFVALAIGGAVGGVISLGYLAIRGRDGVPTLRRAADVFLPLGLAFLLPSLFSAKPWNDKPLTYLVELGCAVLLLEQAMRRSLEAMPAVIGIWLRSKVRPSPALARWLPLSVVLAGSLFYSIYFSYYTILNHQRFGTAGYDLGINVNWAYNALHGHPARCPVLFGESGGHFLGNHAIFGMALWLPFYAIKPGAEVLLIFQATIAGFAASTLYLFAQTQIPRWSAVAIAYAYLFFAPLHGPNFYDFHELLPPLFFHFLLYWAIAVRKNWLVWVLVPVLWSFREDVAVGITVLGLFLAVTGIRPRLGLIMAGASVVWFILIKFVIMPMYWQTWFASIYKELQAPGKGGYGTVVQTILINPAYFLSTMLKEEKLIYFLHFFAPLVFLPARRWSLLFLAIPGFAFSLLTTGYPPTLSIAFQYTCHSIPYVFAAAVLALRVLGRDERGTIKRRAAVSAIALGVASHSYVFGAVLQHETFIGGFSRVVFEMTQEEKLRYQTMVRLASLIPPHASVAATENEVPHVAARIDAYTLKDQGASADYVLLRRSAMGLGNTRSAVRQMFVRDQYGLLDQGHDLYLFKKGHHSDKTEAALRALGLEGSKRRSRRKEN